MKTIIKKGKNKFITICNVCNCTFEYSLEDLMCYYTTDRHYYVNCPYCNQQVIHNVDNYIREEGEEE